MVGNIDTAKRVRPWEDRYSKSKTPKTAREREREWGRDRVVIFKIPTPLLSSLQGCGGHQRSLFFSLTCAFVSLSEAWTLKRRAESGRGGWSEEKRVGFPAEGHRFSEIDFLGNLVSGFPMVSIPPSLFFFWDILFCFYTIWFWCILL